MTTIAYPQGTPKPATSMVGSSLLPAINADAVKIEDGNRGEIHRAIAVARELRRVNLWNGQDPITIYEPTKLFNRIFGFEALPATMLKHGEHYLIVEPVMPSSRPELPVTEDGDILWA